MNNIVVPKCKTLNELLDEYINLYGKDIWIGETLSYALSVCDNIHLKLALNLTFAGPLRIGELLGLTWDCVDVSDEAIEENRAYIYINKELQRVTKQALMELGGKDVMLEFPAERNNSKTVRVLKTPKTDSSVRRVYIPNSVAMDLRQWKKEQDEEKELLGDE